MRQFKVTERKTDRTSVLDKYFSDISKIPILSPEEENELTIRVKNGDEIAKEKLIRANLRFVVSVAKSYAGPKFPLMDLISQGNIGLIESAERFDPSTGFKFISYAIWRIRKNILDYMSVHSRTIKVPRNVLTCLSEIKKIHIEYNQKYERDATVAEIKERFSEMTDKKWVTQKMENIMDGMAADSFNIPLELRNGEDEDSVKAPISWIQSEYDAEDSIKESDAQAMAERLLDVLTLREKKVVMDRMGKNWGFKRSFGDIGKQFGESEAWALRTYNKAMQKLKIKGRRLKSSEKFEI
jgi:RNA polymerase primary sigma factor